VRFRLSSASVFALLVLSSVPHLTGQNVSDDSPFLPPKGTSVVGEASTPETLQLTGISVVGQKTFVSLFDPVTKHSRWIGVGNTVNGIEVVSCDLATDQSLVRVDGQTKLLTLRKSAAGTGASPFPSTATLTPPASTQGLALLSAGPQPSATPLSAQAVQEREARMLVSDLLDIGMQQRKAYEELQRKAAAEEAAKKIPKP